VYVKLFNQTSYFEKSLFIKMEEIFSIFEVIFEVFKLKGKQLT
jgi:hypothetical protein